MKSTTGQNTTQGNNGHTSTISLSRTSNYVLGAFLITETGTVASGDFAGRSWLRTMAMTPSTNLITGCLQPPGGTGLNGTGPAQVL
ncbi:hypothetical protein ABZ891_32040 [Streptomyces sp. NPDC047023]|uniref:hypothetical protein n=1 Tax=Streptomyces sp. NPDC047023 TaxID=3155139 RepID=UPI0033DFABC0